MCELDLGVSGRDLRRVDFVAYGLPLFSGLPIAGDSTMVSPITGRGEPISTKASTHPGMALERATARKHHQNPEFEAQCPLPKVHFIPLPCEVGGRWGDECLLLVRLLAKCKARDSPECLAKSHEQGLLSKWWGMLSVTAQSCFAASLLDCCDFQAVDDINPHTTIDTLLHSNIYEDGPPISRMG